MNRTSHDNSHGFCSNPRYTERWALYLFAFLFLWSCTSPSFADTPQTEKPIIKPLQNLEDKPYENVFIYKKAEFEKGDPYLYGSYHVDDWTINALWGAGALDITRLIFQDGLLIPAANETIAGVNLPGDPADYLIQVNQLNEGRSLFSFNEPKTFDPLRLQITPPSGTYTQTVQVKAVADNGVNVFYRFEENDPWIAYVEGTQDLILSQSKTVQFYASANGVQTPVITVSYTILQPVTADSDSDGIPDALESSFNLPVFSENRDYDQDSWSDLDELVRHSNPLDKTSVPINSDYWPTFTDGWSDYDEIWRCTSPLDPNSKPIVSQIENGEIKLVAIASDPIYKENEPIENRVDSFLWVWSLSGSVIASATLSDTTWEIRLPGEEPYILRAAKQSSPNLVMLGFSESLCQAWRPELFYSGNESHEDWLNLVRNAVIQNSFTVRVTTIDFISMATVLAFEQWIQKELQSPLPIPWYSANQPSIYEWMVQRNIANRLSQVLVHIQSRLALGHPLVDLVAQVMSHASITPPSIPTDRILRNLLNGEFVDPTFIPPAVTPERTAQVRVAMDEVLQTVPATEQTISGVVVYENGQFYLKDDNDQLYLLETGAAELVSGARLTARGHLDSCSSPNPNDPPVFQVSQINENKQAVAFNNEDQDNDGLPDQWERFYFGENDAKPDEDNDSDGAVNRVELQRFTSPLDHDPLTRVRDYWLY